MDSCAFPSWWEELETLARKHGEFVADKDAWRECFDEGQTAAEAFYSEYPEHKP